MATTPNKEFISAYNRLIKEALQDYGNYNSSISLNHLDHLKKHLVSYCRKHISDRLHQNKEFNNESNREQNILVEQKPSEQEKCKESAQVPECNNRAGGEPEINDETECCEQVKCMEPAQIHQSSADPSEIPECKHEILKEGKCSEEEEYMEPSQIFQPSAGAGPPKMIIDPSIVDPFVKLMTEHQKQQQEFQEKIFKTFLDHLNHQHMRQEQNQQQQNKVYEQFLQQQQDFQSKLMEEFMKHSEMQVTRFSQALSNSKTKQPVHDNVDKKETSSHKFSSPEATFNTDHSSSSATFAHYEYSQDTSGYKPSSHETSYNFNKLHNSISGRGSAETHPQFAHFAVANRDKRSFTLFDRHDLGQEFCHTFYNRLNSQNPVHGQEKLDWDLNIFLEDVKFTFVHDYSHEEYIGVDCVSPKLLEMTQNEKLEFTPYLDSERFKCVSSKHGLVVIAVTGLISNNKYSGFFNQIFGLVKCPSTGNYKIKSLHLKVDNANLLNLSVPPLQYCTEQLEDFN